MANRIVAKPREDAPAPADGNSEPTESQNLTQNQAEPLVSQRSWLESESEGRTLDDQSRPIDPWAPPLIKLRRASGSSVSAAFGSIRYPTRSTPWKFVHLAPESSALDVVSLIVDTWKIASPCALIALNPASNGAAAAA